MKNQVDAIRGISENKGIAHVLNSSLNKTEVNQVKTDIDKWNYQIIIRST